MRSLEKLREYVDKQREEYVNHNVSFVWQLNEIADEIEREIAERYMELPVDADGVPIRVGDTIEYKCDEGTYTLHARGIYVYDDGSVGVMNERLGIWYPDACRHVKPRTLEDVLRAFAKNVEAYDANYVDAYAAEIRELLAGEGE